MGEVVPARTSPTLHPPSPPTVHSPVHQLSRLALWRVNETWSKHYSSASMTVSSRAIHCRHLGRWDDTLSITCHLPLFKCSHSKETRRYIIWVIAHGLGKTLPIINCTHCLQTTNIFGLNPKVDISLFVTNANPLLLHLLPGQTSWPLNSTWTEVLCTRRLIQLGFALITFWSWQYITRYWDVCSNHSAISVQPNLPQDTAQETEKCGLSTQVKYTENVLLRVWIGGLTTQVVLTLTVPVTTIDALRHFETG